MGLIDGSNLQTVTEDILAWITDNMGWVFILSSTFFVLFALYLAISKYGKIPLGRDGEKPEYRTVSWIAMMFSAGMGIGLMFFGANEPLTHYVDAPPGTDQENVGVAMATTMFHWGFHPWAMYAVVGLAIALCLSLYLDLRKDPLIVAQRSYEGTLDHNLRTHANIIATEDDSNDVLPSEDFPAIRPQQLAT